MRFFDQTRGNGLKAQLLRGGLGSITIKVVSLLLGFLLAVIMARYMGAEGYGVYAFSFALLSLAAIPAQIGLPQLLVRETAKALLNEDWPLINGLWWWATRFVVLFSLFLLLVGCVILWQAQDLVEPHRHAALLAGLLLIPLIALNNLRDAALRGLQHVVLGQLSERIIRPGFFIILVLFAAWLMRPDTLTPQNAMLLHTVAATFSFIIGGRLLWKAKPRGMQIVQQRKTAPSAWRHAALPLALVSGLQLFNSYADILVLGVFRNDTEVGIYRVVVQMGGLVVFGLSAVNLVLHPHFARLYAQNDNAKLQRLVTVSARIILACALPPVLLFLFFGAPLLSCIFGAEYEGGAAPLSILAIGQLFNAGCGSVGALLNMTGHEKDTMWGMTIAALAGVVLNLLLIPHFGMTGAATATAVSLGIWNLVLSNFVWKRLKIKSSVISKNCHWTHAHRTQNDNHPPNL